MRGLQVETPKGEESSLMKTPAKVIVKRQLPGEGNPPKKPTRVSKNDQVRQGNLQSYKGKKKRNSKVSKYKSSSCTKEHAPGKRQGQGVNNYFQYHNPTNYQQ
jgi:hypothetical protein